MKQSKIKNGKAGGFASELFFWAQALVLSIILLVLFNVFFFRISGVVGSSMVPTLEDGDRVILKVFGYDNPQRGDIVVIKADDFGDVPLVKRVIAVGGDELIVDATTGTVTINGEIQYEPYIKERMTKGGILDYPLYIPEGYVFIMGDNRNGSTDSREIGVQPISNIIGKVTYRLWPLSKLGGV